MLIDCDSCTAGPSACGDCIVTYLLSAAPAATTTSHDHEWTSGSPAHSRSAGAARSYDPADEADLVDRRPDLTESEIAAVGVLAAGGLVPPLRLVTDSAPSKTTRQVRRDDGHRGLGAGSQAG